MAARPSHGLGSYWSSAEGRSGCVPLRFHQYFGTSSHASWPHREFHRRPQRLRSHAVPPRHTLTRLVAP
eukprot:9440797-Pyramimonas_sp.AAC.1